MTHELRLESVAHGGHMVGRLDGRVVFVRHGLPGELVEVELTEAKARDRYWRADAVRVIEPSPHRIEPQWDDAGPGAVGAAEFQHAQWDYQREMKRQVLADAMARWAGVEYDGAVLAVSEDPWHWRTRIDVVAGPDRRAAMRAHRSHDLHALTAMPLATPEVEEACLAGRWNPGTRVRLTSDDAGVLTAPVVLAPGQAPPRRLTYTCDIAGEEYTFRTPHGGFWQVHTHAAAHLARRVVDLVGDAPLVADLYGGVGLFAAPMAKRGARVVTVEGDGAASRMARRNLHQWPHARIVTSPVLDALRSGELAEVTTVVVDPPRTGAGADVMDAIAATAATTVIYVACDPVALARDVATAVRAGFSVHGLEAWDLFPMTHHLEAIAVLTRGGEADRMDRHSTRED